uniref:Uncharacterized protein n=1 Tax=Rhizophora mucronata TaxID=61149 RepID=A0A2P2QQU6_RHIMU
MHGLNPIVSTLVKKMGEQYLFCMVGYSPPC